MEYDMLYINICLYNKYFLSISWKNEQLHGFLLLMNEEKGRKQIELLNEISSKFIFCFIKVQSICKNVNIC